MMNKIELFFEKGYTICKDGFVKNSKGLSVKSSNHILTNGYNRLEICFRFKNKKYNPQVSRLQAYQKYGDEIFKKGVVVRHLNGNSYDNSWNNILIGTQSDNMMDIPKEIRVESATTASRKMQDQVRSYKERCLIYQDLKNKIPYSEIMLKHNISSKGTLSFMKNKSIEYKEYINGCNSVG